MTIFNVYQGIATIFYAYVVLMCVWSIFEKKNADDGRHPVFMRQLGYAMILVPFLLRVLAIR